jgi:hypothetical protein
MRLFDKDGHEICELTKGRKADGRAHLFCMYLAWIGTYEFDARTLRNWEAAFRTAAEKLESLKVKA